MTGNLVFGSHDPDAVELTDDHINDALTSIKLDARNRRFALIAPLALVAAVVTAFIAAPAEHGGLTLLPEADASDNIELPRVFGANGVWRLAEPIQDQTQPEPGPAYTVDIPDEPNAPDFDLVAPESLAGNESLSASASTPPTPTLGQIDNDQPDIDWSIHQPEIRFEVPPTPEPAVEVAEVVESPSPATTSAGLSLEDEDVAENGASLDAADSAPVGIETDAGAQSDANPSTPQAEQPDLAVPPAVTGAVATIVPRSVLVHSAHVSVTVQVVDDDSDVIDWCNTRVDWGDGSVTGISGPDEVAACAASCEREASSSGVGNAEDSADAVSVGIDQEVTFTHEYLTTIAASPRLFIATGDGCSFELAELQLNPFTVVPW